MISAIILGDSPARKYVWQIERLKGKPVLLHCAEALHNSLVDEILLVVGKDYHQILNKISFKSPKLRIVMNRRYERGYSSYVRAGMGMIAHNCEAVFVVRGDYPLIGSSLIDKMIAAYRSEKQGIIIPVYKEQHGYPILFDNRHFNSIKRLTGDHIGGSLVDKYARDLLKIEVQTAGVVLPYEKIRDMQPLDIDKVINDGMPEKELVGISETINISRLESKLKPVRIGDGEEATKEITEKASATGEIPKDAADKARIMAELQKKKAEEGELKVSPDLSLKMLNDLMSKKEKKVPERKIKNGDTDSRQPGKKPV